MGLGRAGLGRGCGTIFKSGHLNFHRAPTLFETSPRLPVLWAPIPESVTKVPTWGLGARWLVASGHPLPTVHTGHRASCLHCHRQIRTHRHVMGRPPAATLWRCHPSSRRREARLFCWSPCHPPGSVGDRPVPGCCPCAQQWCGPTKTSARWARPKVSRAAVQWAGTTLLSTYTAPSRSSMPI